MSSFENFPYFKLIPFFLLVTLYFVLRIPYESPSSLAVGVKCAPIVSLIYFIRSNSFSGNVYCKRIITGLVFSAIGDAFLLFHSGFICGMIAFMVGHIHYMLAFGFRPFNWGLLIIISILGLFVTSILYQGLSGVLSVGVPLYILTIGLMVWRASARIKTGLWPEISGCVGSILFAISDTVLGINSFVQPISYAQVLIMTTYYSAQMCISISVLQPTRR